MKAHKYELGENLTVNKKAEGGMPNYVGRSGKVNELLTHGSFDYELDFGNGVYGKFKEEELDGILEENFAKEYECEWVKNDIEKLTNKDLHKQLLDEIHDTYIRKNADYGNSFEEQFNEYGLLSAIIRFDDKIRRLKQLNKHEAKVKDESIRDSALDLANYAIMTVMELDKLSK